MKNKHIKPLYLKLEIDGYQEDQIVSVSLEQSYRRIKSIKDANQFPEDRTTILKSLKCIYHYYTGKTLK
jgi:hypothetical protein